MKKLPFIGCGAAFYPEHNPPAAWPVHVRMMRECGIQFVRLLEFAWSRMEPREGQYDFAWVDECLELLRKQDIHFLLCTPGATPPQWLTQTYPEALVMHADGRRDRAEVRRHACCSSPAFMSRNLALTRRLVERYGRDPFLVGWQIDNEIGDPACYCPLCEERFRQWLRQEYGTLERANEAFGMVVFSREWSDWSDVHFPMRSQPALHQAFRRWLSQYWQGYVRDHLEVMRPLTDRPITTNMMFPWHGYDHYEMARLLDVTGMDYYPYNPAAFLYPYSSVDLDFALGYTRNIAGGGNFWITETQAAGHNRYQPPPGRIGEWTLRMIAHGADLVNYFRWDNPPFGLEEMSYGIVGPGLYRPPEADDVSAVCRRVERLRPRLEGSRPEKAPAGLLFSYPSWWKMLDHPMCRSWRRDPTHDYPLLLRDHAAGLLGNGVNFDLVGPGTDWSDYALIVAPHCLVVDERLAEAAVRYVRAGGALLLAPVSAIFDTEGVGYPAPYPAPPAWRELFGLSGTANGTLLPDVGEVAARWDNAPPDQRFACRYWIDQFHVEKPESEVWMRYENAFYGRFPALVQRAEGRGRALCLGTVFSADDMPAFYDGLLKKLGIRGHGYPSGIWSRRRVAPDGRTIEFIQNFADTPIEIRLPDGAANVETGQAESGRRLLPPHQTLILETAG